MFRGSSQIRKPISPAWFEENLRTLSEISKALQALKRKPEAKEGCQQVVLDINNRTGLSRSSDYKTPEQRKKEIEKERDEKTKRLAKSSEEKQARAERTRSVRPPTRSHFWIETNATKVAEIKRQRAELSLLKM